MNHLPKIAILLSLLFFPGANCWAQIIEQQILSGIARAIYQLEHPYTPSVPTQPPSSTCDQQLDSCVESAQQTTIQCDAVKSGPIGRGFCEQHVDDGSHPIDYCCNLLELVILANLLDCHDAYVACGG